MRQKSHKRALFENSRSKPKKPVTHTVESNKQEISFDVFVGEGLSPSPNPNTHVQKSEVRRKKHSNEKATLQKTQERWRRMTPETVV